MEPKNPFNKESVNVDFILAAAQKEAVRLRKYIRYQKYKSIFFGSLISSLVLLILLIAGQFASINMIVAIFAPPFTATLLFVCLDNTKDFLTKREHAKWIKILKEETEKELKERVNASDNNNDDKTDSDRF